MITNSVMAATALAAAVILLLISMGYKFGIDGSLGRTGLVQINSLPSGSLVEADGKVQSMRTDFSKGVDAGWHSFVVTRDGYDVWRKTVEIKPGLVTRLNYVRLFPLERQTETLKTEEGLYRVFTAHGRQSILVLKSKTEWELVDIRTNQTRYTPVDVAGLFDREALATAKDIAVAKWSDDGQRVLVRVTMASDVVEWAMIDFTQLSKSVNLNKEFLLEFSEVVMADGFGSKVFVIERGNLRQADVGAKTITSVIQSQVAQIYGYAGRVAYVRNSAVEGEGRIVGVWRDGADGELVVAKLGLETQAVAVAQADFQGRSWVAYVADGKVRVLDGLPDRVGSRESMAVVASQDFGACNGGLSVGGLGRFLRLRCDGATGMIDLDVPQDYYIVDKTEASVAWLDDYMLYLQDSKDTYVIDFDGVNGRWMLPVTGFPVVISTDNSWLYYVQPLEDGRFELQRQRLEI
jgi:hypothetical protein